ncbi:D-xylose transporter [Anaerohalosphaera lusitana]|uniref:D-xylose transporter n=2 Tax=Anaerohalosphaera lusitana TaxID=1936003 RepID=A0A1U9NMV2_9BACT|nr:D-xylose transporter [Anaerohalosphaera lusitana]
MKVNGILLRSSIVAALGGLLFGFDTAVISGTVDHLEKVFQVEGFWLGFTVASALIGTIFGAMFAGNPADRFGRRNTLFILALLYFVSALGSAFAWNWWSFIIFRFIGGLGVGGSSVVAPMYIAEISPAKLRGRLVAVVQFNIVLGILLAFLSNYIVAALVADAVEWRWMFGVEAVPAAAYFFLLFGNPLSPRWLVGQGKSDKARGVLESIGVDEGKSTEDELRDIQVSLERENMQEKEGFLTFKWEQGMNPKYAIPVMLAVLIAMFNQLSGINAVLYYAPNVFKLAGADRNASLLSSVGLGLTNLIFTMLAMLVIDRFGRKKLMLVGSIGYIISLAAVAVTFHMNGNFSAAAETATGVTTSSVIVLVSLAVFIASHAFGQGAVIWVFISEIFPNKVRAKGQSLGALTHWIMAAVISWTFPMFADTLGGTATFSFYGGMMVLQLLWVLFIMPETKDVPLEQIEQKLGIVSAEQTSSAASEPDELRA